MNPRKKLVWLMLCLFFASGMSISAGAESVFAVASHSNSKIKAYLINGDQIDYQDTIKDTESFGIGATGFCVWPEKQRMFVTYEGESIISWASTKTLCRNPDTDEFDTGVSNLAGMAVDETKSFLYVLTRSGGRVYTYTYDENENTLSLIHPNDPCYPEREYRQLPGFGINDATYDLALDEEKSLCYVSNGTKTVRYYNTSDWDLEGSIDIGEKVAGMGIDPNNYLYAGYFNGTSGYHNYLLRYYLNGAPDDPETKIKKDMGAIIMDIAVDSDNGLIYTTTGRSIEGSSGTVEVYDVSDCTPSDANYVILTDTEYDSDFTGNKPAGIAIGPQYMQPFAVEKMDNIEDCVPPQMGEITYTITVDYQWDEESDPDPCEFDSLSIIDYLPQGVDFVSASDNGSYDSDTQTVTWNISLDPFDANCVELTVQTNKSVIPGDEITNKAEIVTTLTIDSKELNYSDSYEIDTSVCDCSDYGRIIRVDADVDVQDPNGATWDLAFNDLQEALAATWPCDEVWVAEGTYRPTTNPSKSEASFAMINTVGVYGGFKGLEGGETQRYERNWFDNDTVLDGYIDAVGSEPNCVDYVVVSDANFVNTIDGFTITGGTIAGIYCGALSPLIVQHNKITGNWTGFYSPESQQPVIKNNWFYKNDYGLYFESPTDIAVVRNNTIANNNNMGIYLHDGVEPLISNCIFTGHPEYSDMVGCYATYSYIEYPIVFDPNATPPDIGEGNIWGDPNYPPFVDGDKDDYRLDPCSICIDAGDPEGDYGAERDIDKHFRVLDGDGDGDQRVDMGADEYCNEGYDNDADFNLDDIVDTLDLIEFAAVWLIDSDDPGWDDTYDLYPDHVIDYIDFAYFANQWLWMTCEMMQGYEMIEMMMGAAGGDSMILAETTMIETSAQASETLAKPTVEEQIKQIKELLDWLDEIKDEIDEATWLNLSGSLEVMLKELEDNQ